MLLDITDKNQQRGENDEVYGYCGINDRGGQFFTWCNTLNDTLASIEDDELDSPKNWPKRAYQEVRGFIRREWAKMKRL